MKRKYLPPNLPKCEPSTRVTDESGFEIEADAVVHSSADSLFSTLSMFAHRENWFRNGRLVIPEPVPVEERSEFESGA